jgi:hypothetical protein
LNAALHGSTGNTGSGARPSQLSRRSIVLVMAAPAVTARARPRLADVLLKPAA